MHLRCPSRIWIHSRLNTDSNFGFSRGQGTSARSPTVACTDLSQIIAESVDCGQAVWTGLPDDLAWSGLGYWPLDGDYEQFSWCWWGFPPSHHLLLWHVVLDIVMNLNHKQTKPAEALLSKPLKDILDVLSVRPEAENHTYNPVPRHVTCTCHESRNSFCLLDTCITVRVLAAYHRITVSWCDWSHNLQESTPSTQLSHAALNLGTATRGT